jgi:hypothetical protein
MTRTKGQLALLCNNFPATISRVDIEVSHLYSNVAKDGTYSGLTDVVKSFEPEPAAEFVLNTLLAPTIAGEVSGLTVSLYEEDEPEPFAELLADDIVMERNTLTFAQVQYEDGVWELAIMIDGEWETVVSLDIEEE